MKTKILFLYPNASGIRRIPLGIAILSSCLKKEGHIVDLFDTTFYKGSDIDNDTREELGFVLKVDMTKLHKTCIETDVRKDFIKKVKSFKPDIIAISLLQDNFHYTKKHFYGFKEFSDAFIIAGNVMPTLAPEHVLRGLDVDAALVGEGETSFVSLADRLSKGKDPYKTENLAYLKDDLMVTNPRGPLFPLTELPHHDYELFDEEHLWRPFVGSSWKTGYLELTRGCPYLCTFCATPRMNTMYKTEGRLRGRKTDQFMDEVKTLKKKYGLKLFFFCDENFLSIEKLDEFCEAWEAEIGDPFMIQTRIETIKLDKVKKLKKANCHTIAVGIESGDYEFRKKILKRQYPNWKAKYAFDVCREVGIRTTANNIIGFPRETEEQIISTIKMNRECKPDSVSIAIFGPYLGSDLFDVCIEDGLLKEDIPDFGQLMYESCLDFPPEHMEMIQYYFNNFHDLVYSDKEIRRPGSIPQPKKNIELPMSQAWDWPRSVQRDRNPIHEI